MRGGIAIGRSADSPVRGMRSICNPRTGLSALRTACFFFGLGGLAGPAISARAQALAGHPDEQFTAFFQRTNGWTAGDGAISIPLSDGRVLWLFGDSHLDDIDPKTGTMPCLFQTRNAGLLQQTNDFRNAQTLVGKKPGSRSWFKNSTNNDEWFWPVCGFQSGDIVYVYLSALRKTPQGGMWGFKSAGHDFWAKINFPEFDRISYSELPSFNGITFGNGFVKEGDTIYAFGGKQNGIAADVFVARFMATTPDQAWKFWNGKDWELNVTNVAPIAHGASTSLHVCKVNGKYLLTSSAFSVACDQGKDSFVSASSSATGPFGSRQRIYTIPDLYQGHMPFFYFPILHPEFINANGEILATYSINGYQPCISACINGRAIPDHYRPKAFRVRLEGITAY